MVDLPHSNDSSVEKGRCALGHSSVGLRYATFSLSRGVIAITITCDRCGEEVSRDISYTADGALLCETPHG